MPTINEIRGDHVVDIAVLGQATPGTADEWPGYVVPYDAEVVSAQWVPSAAVTANGANFAVLSVRNRGAAGAGATLPASRSYAATNSVAFQPDTMVLSADVDVSAGDVLTVEKINTGTGLAIPDGVVQVHLRWR